MKQPKTVAAAIAAVTAYIRTEEAAIAMRSMPRTTPPTPKERFSPWQFSGRQNHMQMHTQMLMKAFHR